MAGFGALSGSMVMLYQKIDTNIADFDQRIDHIDQKLIEVLILMTAPRSGF